MMITPDDIRRAVYIVDTSGIVQMIEDGVKRSNRGRKPAVGHLRLLLIGMFLAVRRRRTATVQDIHDLLTLSLPIDIQTELGVRSTNGDKVRVLTLKNLYYQSERLMGALAYGASIGSDKITIDERRRRRQLVNDISNALMDVFDLGWTSTTYALDATGIWSWAKGGRKLINAGTADDHIDDDIDELTPDDIGDETPMEADSDPTVVRHGHTDSYDGDASWGRKTSKNGREERFFGYHEHTLVQVPSDRQHVDAEPRLICRLELTHAAQDVVDVSLRLLDSLPRPASDLIADLHYSYKSFVRWQAQLITRRIHQHHDIRANEQGFIEYERMRFAAAWAHCPATPDSFGVIQSPQPNAPDEEKAAFANDIDRRRAYALRRINQPDATGAVRYQCPALAGTVGCPLRAGTVQAALENGVPIIENPPNPVTDNEPLPRCCTQASVKVNPPERVRKLSQPLYWGSRQWQRMYSRRTYVEGCYGNRKNPSTENMRRGLFRSTGIVWANLVISMAAASHNLRMLQNWHERTGLGDPTHPLLQPDQPNYGFLFVTLDEHARPAEPPGDATDHRAA